MTYFSAKQASKMTANFSKSPGRLLGHWSLAPVFLLLFFPGLY